MTYMSWHARQLYASGNDVVDVAEKLAEIEVFAALEVIKGRAANPDSFPGYGPTPTPQIIARKAIAALIDAGWTPPEVPRDRP